MSAGNSLGERFRITSFGESHGKCIGVVCDGCPSGLGVLVRDIQEELDKRKSKIYDELATERKEKDHVEILSGIYEGITTGAPICMLVRNEDKNSADYDKIKSTPRPGHADFTNFVKFRGFNDPRGGGRSSGRITAGFVAGGAIAKKILKKENIFLSSKILEIGGYLGNFEEIIKKAKKEKDSVGGIVEVSVSNVPIGLGEPVFDNLDGDIAKAVFSVPGVKGIEFGSGFFGSRLFGSENNDEFIKKKGGKIVTKTNNSGGILGGISNGMPITMKVAIKPTPSIGKKMKSIDLVTMEEKDIEIRGGRHDPCIVPRALPVIESMVAIALVDHIIRFKSEKKGGKKENNRKI